MVVETIRDTQIRTDEQSTSIRKSPLHSRGKYYSKDIEAAYMHRFLRTHTFCVLVRDFVPVDEPTLATNKARAGHRRSLPGSATPSRNFHQSLPLISIFPSWNVIPSPEHDTRLVSILFHFDTASASFTA